MLTDADNSARPGGFPPEFDGRRRAGVKCIADGDGCGFHFEARASNKMFGRTLPASWAALESCPDCGGDVITFDYPGYTTSRPK